ncbi:related to Diphthamide biosynthesis protein 4 [Saccharomycodes ludwigii]|uniref:Diphthamide biosynthesis protein 4 n=1 Tax=Saccharomycodes ludwigii TaxID=36035 RepID=A0A376B5T6_9ASCO|nr:related to Diphthamide biosynthesis protein 4 [Saccharomycodes ludwigii]
MENVPVNCTTLDIKAAYKEKLLKYHPDKNKNATNVGPYSIQQIKEAYEVLSNPDLRDKYQKELINTSKKIGFSNTGDGLDEFSLDDFILEENANDDEFSWYMDCPRCNSKNGFYLTEKILESQGEDISLDFNSQMYQIIVQCSMCSLWIKVNYAQQQEE